MRVTACAGAPPPGADFYTLAPCRLVDSRRPSEGPALQPGERRTLAPAGVCGVPATAVALSVNVTVTEPAAPGHLVLFPANQPAPPASTINFPPGATRANNAVLPLSPGGLGAIDVLTATDGTVHLIVDVNDYFQ